MRQWKIAACLICAAGAMQAVPVRADDRSDAVDSVFARWSKPGTPGMSIAIVANGKPLYVRSYGIGNLELSRANTPDLIYPIGSATKQFTAFCIQLLAKRGKISLDADIHEYILELPRYRWPVTVRMLLTHTSGVRDNVSLLLAKGRRVDDVISESDSLNVLVQQGELNYVPGSRYLYSNGNYVLLAKIVERLSGTTFANSSCSTFSCRSG